MKIRCPVYANETHLLDMMFPLIEKAHLWRKRCSLLPLLGINFRFSRCCWCGLNKIISSYQLEKQVFSYAIFSLTYPLLNLLSFEFRCSLGCTWVAMIKLTFLTFDEAKKGPRQKFVRKTIVSFILMFIVRSYFKIVLSTNLNI